MNTLHFYQPKSDILAITLVLVGLAFFVMTNTAQAAQVGLAAQNATSEADQSNNLQNFIGNKEQTQGFLFKPAQNQVELRAYACFQGTNAKRKLQQLSPYIAESNVRKYQVSLANYLSTAFGLSERQVVRQLLVMGVKAKQTQAQHEFQRMGNEVCSQSIATIDGVGQKISDEFLAQLLPFEPASHYFYFGTEQENQQNIVQLITANQLKINDEFVTQASEVSYQNKAWQYLSFDLDSYKSLLTQVQKSVYLSISSSDRKQTERYQKALSAYFSQHGFEIKQSASNAYWYLDINVSKVTAEQARAFIAISVDATTDNTEQPRKLVITNSPSKVPVSATSNYDDAKAIEVHLELMQLAQKLVSSS